MSAEIPGNGDPGSAECACAVAAHVPRLVVLTGGPGAGKTAVLELARRRFCRHVRILPEAASLLFRGGFPRHPTVPGRAAAQRAIARVQREMERMALEEGGAAVILCDRGLLDGLAYWPGGETEFLADLGTSRAAELARYAAVIHLRPPDDGQGYNRSNPARVESAHEALQIDGRLEAAWQGHPRRTVIPSTHDFLEKAQAALEAVRREVPACCGG